VRADAIRLGYAVQGRDASQTIHDLDTVRLWRRERGLNARNTAVERAVVLFMRAGRFACRQCRSAFVAERFGA
jgi:hypothetical protein